MKCSAEWGIAIAFGTWYEFESETQSGIESETESGTESGTHYEIEWLPLYKSSDCSLQIAVCSLLVAANM